MTRDERDRDIVARKARGESSAAIGRRYGLSSTRIDQIKNVAQGRCHYWRNSASSRDTEQRKIMRQIERLPRHAQSEIHRWLELRAPRDEIARVAAAGFYRERIPDPEVGNIIRQIERLPISAQCDIHRGLENRAPE
jgi:hypothetical protein